MQWNRIKNKYAESSLLDREINAHINIICNTPADRQSCTENSCSHDYSLLLCGQYCWRICQYVRVFQVRWLLEDRNSSVAVWWASSLLCSALTRHIFAVFPAPTSPGNLQQPFHKSV